MGMERASHPPAPRPPSRPPGGLPGPTHKLVHTRLFPLLHAGQRRFGLPIANELPELQEGVSRLVLHVHVLGQNLRGDSNEPHRIGCQRIPLARLPLASQTSQRSAQKASAYLFLLPLGRPAGLPL
jgi:hypothetical protein